MCFSIINAVGVKARRNPKRLRVKPAMTGVGGDNGNGKSNSKAAAGGSAVKAV